MGVEGKDWAIRHDQGCQNHSYPEYPPCVLCSPSVRHCCSSFPMKLSCMLLCILRLWGASEWGRTDHWIWILLVMGHRVSIFSSHHSVVCIEDKLYSTDPYISGYPVGMFRTRVTHLENTSVRQEAAYKRIKIATKRASGRGIGAQRH